MFKTVVYFTLLLSFNLFSQEIACTVSKFGDRTKQEISLVKESITKMKIINNQASYLPQEIPLRVVNAQYTKRLKVNEQEKVTTDLSSVIRMESFDKNYSVNLMSRSLFISTMSSDKRKNFFAKCDIPENFVKDLVNSQ